MNFVERMKRAMQQIGTVALDGDNSYHNYKYVTHHAIKAACNAAMREYGLYIKSALFSESHNGNKTYTKCTVTVTDGESEASADGLGMGEGNKAPMVAGTSAYKYALCHLFCIPAADESDAEADSSSMAQEYFDDVAEKVYERAQEHAIKASLRDIKDAIRSNWNYVPSKEAINKAVVMTMKDLGIEAKK